MTKTSRAKSLRSPLDALREVLSEVEARPHELREILARAPQALFAFNRGRQILCANEAADAFFCYPTGGLEGRSTEELLPPRMRQPEVSPIVSADLIMADIPGLLFDGTECLVEWSFSSVCRDTQPVFVASVRDRENVDRMIEELRVSEERFQLLVNGVKDYAIFMLDADGLISSWNSGAARIKGWDEVEVLGRSYEMFFTEEDCALNLPNVFLGLANSGGSVETEGWRIRKDGSRFWAQGSLTVLRDSDGHVRGYAKITRDLTERIQAAEAERRLAAESASREAAEAGEKKLRASEQRLARLQRATAALSVAVTPQDVAKVILCESIDALDADGCSVFQLAADGGHLELLEQRGYPDTIERRFRVVALADRVPVADAAREGRPHFFETLEERAVDYPELRDVIGEGNFEAVAAMPLVVQGTLVGALGIAFHKKRTFDPSDRAYIGTLSEICAQAFERARLFAAERAARASAEAANRSKDEFLAMLGHELRNPLAPILTAVQLMKLKDDTHLTKEREVIERQLTHLGTLVDDLLDVSRLTRGLIALSRVPIEISKVFARAVEMVSPLYEQRSQHLRVVASNDGLLVNADPFRIAQVIANLLTNAAKYTRQGGHIWLTGERDGQDVVIRVRDDGEGISPDLLPKIFELFVQGTRTIARSEGGLGLGLALVRNLVTLHGGTVKASSAGIGQGSEFEVRLPLFQHVEMATPVEVAPSEEPTPLHRRILVVDDNDDAAETIADLLRYLGHEVTVAHDGPSALASLNGFSADIAILDLGLPGMDGFELARRIRQNRGDSCPRLIALTGYGREGDVAAGRAAGFEMHLVKPIDEKSLLNALDPGDASSQRPAVG